MPQVTGHPIRWFDAGARPGDFSFFIPFFLSLSSFALPLIQYPLLIIYIRGHQFPCQVYNLLIQLSRFCAFFIPFWSRASTHLHAPFSFRVGCHQRGAGLDYPFQLRIFYVLMIFPALHSLKKLSCLLFLYTQPNKANHMKSAPRQE